MVYKRVRSWTSGQSCPYKTFWSKPWHPQERCSPSNCLLLPMLYQENGYAVETGMSLAGAQPEYRLNSGLVQVMEFMNFFSRPGKSRNLIVGP